MKSKTTPAQAATKIQHFWQKKQCFQGLAGSHNYDYYLSLLSLGDPADPYNLLACMMYGRVISTPNGAFPFLKQPNPYLGHKPNYHRLDLHGTPLTDIILSLWGHQVDANFIYIPVADLKIGSIHEALKAIGWTPVALNHPIEEMAGDKYQLIQPPTQALQAQNIQFIRIKKINPYDDTNFTDFNRWGMLSSLGVIASPWLLSVIALASGYQPTLSAKATNLTKQALARQPRTVKELQKSPLIRKLNSLKNNTTSEASLLAAGLYLMIMDLPVNINAPDNVARLALFIETALMTHQDDHAQFANLLYPIIHEMSLLLFKSSQEHQTPYIGIHDYQTLTMNDIQPWTEFRSLDHEFIALPANSGTHASFIASLLAQEICTKGKKDFTVRRHGGEYWEVNTQQRNYTLLGSVVNGTQADVCRISAGPIGDYHLGTLPAIDINQLIRQEITRNKQLKVILIDTTSASYEHLKLTEDVKELLVKHNISLIFWESFQKFGLLHTDQAQQGRVFAFCHKSHMTTDKLTDLKKAAEADLMTPDAQIGAFINRNCQAILPQIREKHFANGLIFRQILAVKGGRDTHATYELRVANQKDPFINVKGHFDPSQIKKMTTFFGHMNLVRSSFGHRYTTQESSRISVGAESKLTATVLANALNYYVQLDEKNIHKKLIAACNSFKINSDKELIKFLSLLKAWSVCSNHCQMTYPMANHLQKIIHSSNVLKGSPQLKADIYQIFKERSPFAAMVEEAEKNADSFAILLLQALDNTYKKTGKVKVDDAIKKALRSTQNIPLTIPISSVEISRHRQKLFWGDYSQLAGDFFADERILKKPTSAVENNIFLAIEAYLAHPNAKMKKKIRAICISMQAEAMKGPNHCHTNITNIIASMSQNAHDYSARMTHKFILTAKESDALKKIIPPLDITLEYTLADYIEGKCGSHPLDFIYQQNAKIYLKAHELLLRGHEKTGNILTRMCEQIKIILDDEDNEARKIEQIKTILLQTQNDLEVKKHRGHLKSALSNFLLILSVVGIGFLAVTANTRGSFFYRPNTDTENCLEKFGQTITEEPIRLFN